mmetsp:Transcript_10650/g.23435  ORF Transcript_10650/g.23435 Transcript_10650/m.23435 type:complete len:341 (-) Transcript_10650:220-1242(-)
MRNSEQDTNKLQVIPPANPDYGDPMEVMEKYRKQFASERLAKRNASIPKQKTTRLETAKSPLEQKTANNFPSQISPPSSGLTDNKTISTTDYRSRLLQFYEKYNPEKAHTIDSLLSKYKGKEKELFAKLEYKYEGKRIQSAFPALPPIPNGATSTVYLHFRCADGKRAGTVHIRLHTDPSAGVPLAAENFRTLCTGEAGTSLTYAGSRLHRVIGGFMAQGGDFTKGNGTGGKSIYSSHPNWRGFDVQTNLWGNFPDEKFYAHDRRGLVSMANNGRNQNGSQFFITFKAVPHLDGKHVVFGEVVKGMEVLDWIEKVKTETGNKPVEGNSVTIIDCGMAEEV